MFFFHITYFVWHSTNAQLITWILQPINIGCISLFSTSKSDGCPTFWCLHVCIWSDVFIRLLTNVTLSVIRLCSIQRDRGKCRLITVRTTAEHRGIERRAPLCAVIFFGYSTTYNGVWRPSHYDVHLALTITVKAVRLPTLRKIGSRRFVVNVLWWFWFVWCSRMIYLFIWFISIIFTEDIIPCVEWSIQIM